MARRAVLTLVMLAAVTAVCAGGAGDAGDAETAVDVARQVYDACVRQGSLACVRPRVLAFLTASSKRDGVIRITRDLAVVPAGNTVDGGAEEQTQPGDAAGSLLLERVQRFLEGHDLRVTVPAELTGGDLGASMPRALLNALPAEIRMPLDPEREDGARHHRRRGFLKKVVLPFILGLKFKTTVLIPLALSLIALKTWKALTLGLLSLVLSGAMVIFRFTKPKVVNYDVYHYPQHHGHYEHHIDHHPGYDHGHYDHYDHHSYARSGDDIAYSAHQT